MQQIKDKFLITLKLDEDNYYYVIALIMAYLYHRDGYSDGFTAADIRGVGVDLGIGKIADLPLPKLTAFLEEMGDLNVLRDTGEGRFLFTRFTFFQMMGTAAEVEDKLTTYMED